MIKKNNSFGFTLTEVLLAVMIVGLIGVSLAALTRASAREGGIGRSKIMLRNNLSMFMRTLRADLTQATYVAEVAGAKTISNTTPVTLLKIAQGVDAQGEPLSQMPTKKWITYCFVRGTDNASPIAPVGAYRGGKIYRLQNINSATKFLNCDASALTASTLLLDNVKYISPSTAINPGAADLVYYPVPLFERHNFNRTGVKNLITVRVIVELNSKPIVNDVIEETFSTAMGY